MVRARIELLTLRRRNKIDDIKKSIPIPKRAVPQNALPGWSDLPLYQKLPMLNCPTNQIVFSRQKVGNKLHNTKNTGFVLYDPNCHDVSYQYELVHDPHLKHFFKQKPNIERTKEIGKVTQDNEALCTLKEFNEYRQFYNRVHNDAVNLEIKRRDELCEDRRRFEHAEVISKDICKGPREIELQKYRESEFLKQKNYRNFLNMEILHKFSESLNRAKEIKMMNRNKLKERGNELNARISEKQKKILDRERERIIKLRKIWTEKEGKRLENKEKELLHSIEKQVKEDLIRWENKMDFRLMKQHRNEAILAKAERQTERKVAKRKRQIKKIIERTEHKILLKKAAILLSRYENRSIENLSKVFYARLKNYAIKMEKSKEKHLKDLLKNPDEITDERELAELIKMKEYSRGVCKAIEIYETPEISAAGLNEPVCGYQTLTYKNIHDAISCALKTSYGFNQPLSTMDIYNNAKLILDRIANQNTFDLPRDEYIRAYVLQELWTRMKFIEDNVYNNIKSLIDEKEERLVLDSKPKKTILSTCCRSQSPDSKKTLKKKTKRKTTFGPVKIIGKSKSAKSSKSTDEECEYKTCVGRPNTPVTNLKRLADIVLSTENTDEEVVISNNMNLRPLTHVTRPQKLIILSNLERFSEYYKLRIEMYVMSSINLSNFHMKKHAIMVYTNPTDEQKYIDEMASIILTLPENDSNFTKTLLMLTNITAKRLITNVSVYLREKINENELIYNLANSKGQQEQDNRINK